jgi:exodeoxyribonuclease VII large subunit
VLKVVCWSSRWSRVRTTLDQLGITLDAGLVVRVRGEVQLYKPRGDISFILSEFDTDALLGKLAAERARVIKALTDEGLLDRNRSLPIPAVPLKIGLVASPGTEGYRDFLGQLEASGFAFDVRAVATQVQGRDAHRTVARAIRALGSTDCDLIVLVRGGGSKADLAAFDSEVVARVIATSPVPVWTGIGHTGDQSVADEVASRSYITPTECGQELARRATEYWDTILSQGVSVGRRAAAVLDRSAGHLDGGRRRLASGIRMQLGRHGDGLAHRIALLSALPARSLEREARQLTQWSRLLGAYDYQRQLERGYSVTRNADGAVIRSMSGLLPGVSLTTQLADGDVLSVVEATTTRTGTDDRRKGDTPS